MNSVICPALSLVPTCVDIFAPAAVATLAYLVVSISLMIRGGTQLGMMRLIFWSVAIAPSFFYSLTTQTPTAPTPLSSAFMALFFCLGATVARACHWSIAPRLYGFHWPEFLFVTTSALTVGTFFSSFWFAQDSGGIFLGFSGWRESQIWVPPSVALAYYFSCRANPSPTH